MVDDDLIEESDGGGVRPNKLTRRRTLEFEANRVRRLIHCVIFISSHKYERVEIRNRGRVFAEWDQSSVLAVLESFWSRKVRLPGQEWYYAESVTCNRFGRIDIIA